MSNINWDSIMDKLDLYLDSNQGQKAIRQAVKNQVATMTLSGDSSFDLAAQKFIQVMHYELASLAIAEGGTAKDGKLGPTAISALYDMDYGKPYDIGNGQYAVPIWFENDLHRKSLYPKKYPDGVENIADLLNSGYSSSHGATLVFGIWEGHVNPNRKDKMTRGILPTRSGAHFIDNAIADFMGNYSSEFGVVRIEPSGEYRIKG